MASMPDPCGLSNRNYSETYGDAELVLVLMGTGEPGHLRFCEGKRPRWGGQAIGDPGLTAPVLAR